MNDIPDPLDEKFKELERSIAQRQLHERQATCPHEDTHTIVTIGEPDRLLCRNCHLIFTKP